MPFAGVSTKPDFSQQANEGFANHLFVEMKYPKDRRRLNGVITEITSRVLMAKQYGIGILFGIYDPNRAIVDDDVFATDIQDPDNNIWVIIIR